MKNIVATINLLIFSIACYAQMLHLSISNPQPRLNQDFTLSVNIDTLNERLFHFLAGKFEISPVNNDGQFMSINAQAAKVGKNTIGPLSLEFNGVKYVTNKVEFNVADSLPAVNKGLWIRKVIVSDSEFTILIEQRTPALTYYTHTDNSIKMETKTSDSDKNTELLADSIDNSKSRGWSSESKPQSIYMPDGELKFGYYLAIYKFTIADKRKAVIFRKSDFKNLPDYYKFENIVVN